MLTAKAVTWLNFCLFILRIVGAVYELVGFKGDNGKARELFNKMDKNRDGFVSQEEFMEVIRGDKNLLNIVDIPLLRRIVIFYDRN